MSNSGNQPKAVRREHAREQARLMREKEQKRSRRNKWIVQGLVVVSVLVIGALIAAFFINGNKSFTATGPLNMASDGILLEGNGTDITAVTTGSVKAGDEPVATDQTALADTVNIVMYVDYQCPYCQTFEATNTEQISEWVSSGAATLEIHPIAFLDGASLGTKYSTRAANAAACVANYQPDSYFAVNTALFENQPAEQTAGLSDNEIKGILSDAGVDNDDVSTCISDGEFKPWTKVATTRVTGGEIPNSDQPEFQGTPMVVVNGTLYTGAIDDATAFGDFVNAIGAALEASQSTSTPTPTPSNAG